MGIPNRDAAAMARQEKTPLLDVATAKPSPFEDTRMQKGGHALPTLATEGSDISDDETQQHLAS